MRTSKKLIGGALGLLLLNALFFLATYKEKVEKPQIQVKSSKNKIKTTGDTLIIEKGSTTLKLHYSSKKLELPYTVLKNPKVEVGFKEGRLTGKSERGILLGKTLVLKKFSGNLCGAKLEADRVRIDLNDLNYLELRSFKAVAPKRFLVGRSDFKVNLNAICDFLKGKTDSPE
ncbi:hypothetical protein [Thermovibrio sp.]